MTTTTTYRVEYYDFDDEFWCNADQSLSPCDFTTYDYAVRYRDAQRDYNSKMRIVKRTITSEIVETD